MFRSLRALSVSLANGSVSSRALVEEALERILDKDGEGSRAFLTVASEGARAQADFYDRERQAGHAVPPFAGIPFSVKDLFDIAGEVTRAGSRVLADSPPATSDAPAIARLRAAGFIVIGRTNMTEFAYSGVGLNLHYGTPRSPYQRDVGRIPGGSSSGAAVSVADGMCPLAIGSDTGGSTRIPAAYCEVTGYKPSTGRVPTDGAYPLSMSLDSIGPIARTVDCCAIADALMAGAAPPPVAKVEASSLRFAVPVSHVIAGLDESVSHAFGRALDALRRAKISIYDLACPEIDDIPGINARAAIALVEAHHHHRRRLETRGNEYDPRVSGRMLGGARISAADYVETLIQRPRLIAWFSRAATGFDAFVSPTAPNIPPAIVELARDEDYLRLNAVSLRNTSVANFLDGCAISIPMNAPGEPPTGLMLMAPNGRDSHLLAVAAAVERGLRSITASA